jgi:hypothetical protein
MRRSLVIAATLLICLAVGAPALAAPRSFYGVISAQDPSASELARMGTGKVGTLRINLVWAAVQPESSAQFDWSHYDAVIGAAAQNGIRVLPTVYGSPSWAAGAQNQPPSSQALDAFRTFARAAAERYGSTGTFWTMNPAIPRLPVIDWQLWNEANSPSFWRPRPSPRAYVTLLRAFSDGIRGADPSARIILTGLFPTPQVRRGIRLDRFLPALYRLGAKPLFDAAALHPYSTTPRDAIDRVRELRRLMSRFKDRKTPIWITEIGWATGGPRTPLTVSARRQAAYLRKAYKLMAANRGRFRVAGVVWYSWRDVGGGIWFNHTGLFTVDLAPKPSWSAFTRLTGGTP